MGVTGTPTSPGPGERSGGMTALASIVDAGGAGVPRLMERIEARMLKLVVDHGEMLAGLARETLEAGGKRVRPLLVLLAAGVPPPESEGLVKAAVAVELVHAATLVHDDVLDGSALRRGRPTVVATAGRRLATATGDLLFSRAFAELASTGSIEGVQALSRACSELAAGEMLQREDAWRADVDVPRYLERCRLKTGVLFRAACELGALEGDRDRARVLARFGEQIGVAFQMLDDVLDVSGPAGRTGKARGTDLLDGTVTLPLILARDLDPTLRSLALRELSTPADALAVCERIAASGALESARRQALDLAGEAKLGLADLPERQRETLELVATGVVERYA